MAEIMFRAAYSGRVSNWRLKTHAIHPDKIKPAAPRFSACGQHVREAAGLWRNVPNQDRCGRCMAAVEAAQRRA